MIDFYDVADRTEAGNECRGGTKNSPRKTAMGFLSLLAAQIISAPDMMI